MTSPLFELTDENEIERVESVNLQLRREKQRKGTEKKQSDTDTAIQFDFHLLNDDAEKLAHEMVAQGIC